MESALCVVLTQYMLVPSSRQEIEFLNIETREVEGTVIIIPIIVIIIVHSTYYVPCFILGTSAF